MVTFIDMKLGLQGIQSKGNYVQKSVEAEKGMPNLWNDENFNSVKEKNITL
jgi:hypothetical protein